ncbi:MAG: NAD(P)H-hydrate dehydratase [Bacteriovoracaceae bacterium]|jgi:ADP-dependent NAD(P)H-hydrate dehydratase / NAD(P)H-hydrate epimerase|nr:NAD(P)H-hydrate dehydratase [Bacteriovoracaceae bacterium]
MRIVNTAEMKEIEELTFSKFGMTESLIIENVGSDGADYLFSNFLKDRDFGEIVLLVGRGNNGADGLAIGRHLIKHGISVRAFMLFSEADCSDELKFQLQLARNYGIKVNDIKDPDELLSYFHNNQDEYFVIDAIFGTGVRLPLSAFVLDVIKLANEYADEMVSIDIPSGIMGDTGFYEGGAIKATTTLAIAAAKIGHLIDQGPQRIGKLHILDAGFPPELLMAGNKKLIDYKKAGILKKKRSRFAHKNTFGHCLVVGGSPGLTGALALASKAALKVGVGLVTAITWERSYQEMCSRVIPEIMMGKIPIDDEKAEALLLQLENFSSVVIGPGLGWSEYSRRAVVEVMKCFDGPVVLDADAINVLSLEKDRELLQKRADLTVLTPHLGEFARFIGVDVKKILEDPITHLKDVVDKTGVTILLKGPSSFVALPTGDIYVNYLPNEGLATGGSGDVLAGVLGGMLAQKATEIDRQIISPSARDEKEVYYQGICLGLVLHSMAGDIAGKKLGRRVMTAGDVIENFSDAFKKLDEVKIG